MRVRHLECDIITKIVRLAVLIWGVGMRANCYKEKTPARMLALPTISPRTGDDINL
jgi:hypothetical protein